MALPAVLPRSIWACNRADIAHSVAGEQLLLYEGALDSDEPVGENPEAKVWSAGATGYSRVSTPRCPHFHG